MIYRYVYDPIALVEYMDALTWYKYRSIKASEGFVIAVKERIKKICKNPLQYRNTYKHFRQTSINKYPFYIIYFIDEDKKTVVITSVYHHKRNPKKKFKK